MWIDPHSGVVIVLVVLALYFLGIAGSALFAAIKRNRAALSLELRSQREKLINEQSQWQRQRNFENDAIRKLAAEKSGGFPWLATAYADFFLLQDMMRAEHLETKNRPALKTAERMREVARKRAHAERLHRLFRYKLLYYESLFPWLVEFQDEGLDDIIAQTLNSPEEATHSDGPEDPVQAWVTAAEYRDLTTAQRNQRALERYRKRRKSNWEIGRDYERYIGWRYESEGWFVHYHGILEGFADMGRDLISIEGNEILVIQCKCWSADKTIHENHVCQLFGTVTKYRIDNPQKCVTGLLATSTKLSERAKQFAHALDIKILENIALATYPCIKCNVSYRTGELIYHLPFDLQYDRTQIDNERNERYVNTVAEAEAFGFRRAFRWNPDRGSSDASATPLVPPA